MNLEFIGALLVSSLALMALSFLYRHNSFFRIAESITISGLVGYATVLSFKTVWTRGVVPALGGDLLTGVALIVGCMIYLNFSGDKKIRWFARVPVMVLVGVGLGTSIRAMIQAQLVSQILDTMRPIVTGNLVDTISNIIIIVGTISTISYFYYSKEQTGSLEKIGKVGRLTMMVAFGASYGKTFLSRLAKVIAASETIVTYPGYLMLPIAIIILAYGIWRDSKQNNN